MDYKSTSAEAHDICEVKVSYTHCFPSSVQTYAFTVQLKKFGYTFTIIFKHIPKITYLRIFKSRFRKNYTLVSAMMLIGVTSSVGSLETFSPLCSMCFYMGQHDYIRECYLYTSGISSLGGRILTGVASSVTSLETFSPSDCSYIDYLSQQDYVRVEGKVTQLSLCCCSCTRLFECSQLNSMI